MKTCPHCQHTSAQRIAALFLVLCLMVQTALFRPVSAQPLPPPAAPNFIPSPDFVDERGILVAQQVINGGPPTPISIANGGTNITTYTTGDTLYASGANTLSKLAIGSAGQVKIVSGGIPAWGTVNATNGGTNQTTWTTGDLLYASGANTLSKLGIGSSTQVLTVTGGVPVWAAASGGGSPGGSANQFQYQVNGTTFGGDSGFTRAADGVETITSSAVGSVPLTVRGTSASQTSDLLDIGQNGSTILFPFKTVANAQNGLSFTATATDGTYIPITAQGVNNNLGIDFITKGTGFARFTASGASVPGIEVNGASSQTGDYFRIKQAASGGSSVFLITPSSNASQVNGFQFTTGISGVAPIIAPAGSSADANLGIQVGVKASSSGSLILFGGNSSSGINFKNSNGTSLGNFDGANGNLTVNYPIKTNGYDAGTTAVSNTYTVLYTDEFNPITTGASSFTVSLVASPTVGEKHTFIKLDSGVGIVTIAGNGHNILTTGGAVATKTLAAQGNTLTVIYDGATWSVVSII